eukprot:scaffold10085_cov120-Isochrysis_galbana.AAC.2
MTDKSGTSVCNHLDGSGIARLPPSVAASQPCRQRSRCSDVQKSAAHAAKPAPLMIAHCAQDRDKWPCVTPQHALERWRGCEWAPVLPPAAASIAVAAGCGMCGRYTWSPAATIKLKRNRGREG